MGCDAAVLLAAAVLVLAPALASGAAGEGLEKEGTPAVERLPLPLDEEKMRSCGDPRWQRWYAGLVRRMEEGQLPRRYLVNPHVHTGLSDRLVSTMSTFWAAVASERALLIASDPGTHGLEAAYDWRSFNATPRENYTGWNEEGMLAKRGWHWGNLSAENREEHMLWHTWQGRTYDFFEERRFRDLFYEFGVHPDAAFGCAMNYLLKPNQAVRSMFADQFAVMERKDILKIGIQVRMGDEYIAQPEKFDTMANVQQHSRMYFECATELEERYKEDYREVVWFLITDSTTLRQWARREYGSKLVTMTHTRVEHSSRGQNFNPFDFSGNHTKLRASETGFRVAAGEHWLFGLADYHIISMQSGFGRTAAFRSLRSDTLYTLDTDVEEGKYTGLANCSVPWGFTRPYDAAHHWSHI